MKRLHNAEITKATMTDPKVRALVVSHWSSAAISLFVRAGDGRNTTRQLQKQGHLLAAGRSRAYSHNLAQIKAGIFKLFFFQVVYFKAYTPQWQLLGQTSSIWLRSILVLCWNSARLLSTAGIPPSSTRLHLKAILFNSLIYHKNRAAVYTSRGQTKARVPSAFGGGLLRSAPTQHTPHCRGDWHSSRAHSESKDEPRLKRICVYMTALFPLSLSSTQTLYLSRALIYRKFEMYAFSFSSAALQWQRSVLLLRAGVRGRLSACCNSN